MKKPDVKTIAKARRMSLIKWKRIGKFSDDLFNEIDSACGFCFLGRHRAGSVAISKCDHCGVETRCNKILEKSNAVQNIMDELIDKTIEFLEEMDVKKK